jgi:hypothetical protein
MIPLFFFWFLETERQPPHKDRQQSDQKLLTSLIALERFFGRKAWSWENLADFGLSLSREEARRYLKLSELDSPLTSEREALFEYLFDHHPELKISAFSSKELSRRLQDHKARPRRPIFGGVGVSEDQYFPCVLNFDESSQHPQLRFPDKGTDLVECVRWLKSENASTICIDGPPFQYRGLLGKKLPADCDENRERRLAEFSLGIGGELVESRTASGTVASKSKLTNANKLFDGLARCLGVSIDLGDGEGELIETDANQAFQALVGFIESEAYGLKTCRTDPEGRLLSGATNEGFNQRIKLVERAMKTLGSEVLPEVRMVWNRGLEWVDASISAIVAAERWLNPGDVRSFGDPREGAIHLYMPMEKFPLDSQDIR